jgi:hypothetical protein
MKNLYQRIIAVMDDLGAVGKTGRTNYGEKFEYHRIDDIDDQLRTALIANGLVVVPTAVTEARITHVEELDRAGKPRTTWHAECQLEITLINADQPEERLEIAGWGQGIDYSDKATGKALAYAAKSAYLSAFHLRGQPDVEAQNIERAAPPTAVQLTGHQVVQLQQEINNAPTEDTLQALLRGDVYQQLKNAGPADVYEQTRSLAMAKAAVLKT